MMTNFPALSSGADSFGGAPGEHQSPDGASDQRFHRMDFPLDRDRRNSARAHIVRELAHGLADTTIGGSGRSFSHRRSGDLGDDIVLPCDWKLHNRRRHADAGAQPTFNDVAPMMRFDARPCSAVIARALARASVSCAFARPRNAVGVR